MDDRKIVTMLQIFNEIMDLGLENHHQWLLKQTVKSWQERSGQVILTITKKRDDKKIT